MACPRQRFNERYRVDSDTGCWLWTAGYSANGYGKLRVNGPLMGAHRLSYLLHVGEIPDGMCVCHRCDNPACVNPDHLFLGTHADNMKDKHKKGRCVGPDRKGSKNTRAKLTEKQVKGIRAANEARASLAKRYGVSCTTIYMIRSGKSWTHV